MKKQLNEVKRLQKIAGILKENVNPEQEAQNILDDLSAERDPMELAGMTPEDALETVEAYGHTGPLAQEIADNLVALAGGLNENVNEARGGQLQPIDPAALKRVIALGVKSEVILDRQDASYLMKRFVAIPALVNKAIAGDEKAYYDVMAGGDWPSLEYSNADDKRLAKYYEKLSDLMAAVDAVMYDGELEMIPSRWNKLKAHIEGMQ